MVLPRGMKERPPERPPGSSYATPQPRPVRTGSVWTGPHRAAALRATEPWRWPALRGSEPARGLGAQPPSGNAVRAGITGVSKTRLWLWAAVEPAVEAPTRGLWSGTSREPGLHPAVRHLSYLSGSQAPRAVLCEPKPSGWTQRPGQVTGRCLCSVTWPEAGGGRLPQPFQ